MISLSEYLNTSYEPEMEFVDGLLVRKKGGEQLHGLLQTALTAFFSRFETSHRFRVFTNCRLLVDAVTGRHRVPDLMVVPRPFQKGKVVVDVPLIVVEIKSPDDTFDDILDKCFEYENLSVRNILVMDPDNRRAWHFRQGNLHFVPAGPILLDVPPQAIEFPFAEMFARLDEE